MEEIKAGEYVRDTEGEIYKADEIFLKHANVEIKKHSFNIIDLIEEGDFVNDKKVKINYKDAILFEDDSDIVEQQIRKIVTHEQMEAVEYEVK